MVTASARRILFVFFALHSCVFAQQYPFVPVKSADAPVNIWTLMQDHLGRIWAGTFTGVDCFDGNRFYHLRDYGLPDAVWANLAEDDEGGIWMGGEPGLYRFAKGQITTLEEGFVGNVVRAGPGVMLALIGPKEMRDKGLKDFWRFGKAGGDWKAERLPLPKAAMFSASFKDSITFVSSTVWSEVKLSEITRWRSGMRIEMLQHAIPRGLEPSQVLRDSHSCVWFRGEVSSYYQCEGSDEIRTVPDTTRQGGMVLSETPDGRIVLPTDNSLAIGGRNGFKVAKAANGLPLTNSVLAAADGSVWIGSLKGLFRFAHAFEFEYWNQRDGLSTPRSLLHLGKRFFLADDEGIKELAADRRNWSLLPHLPNLGGAMHLLPGPKNTIYAALRNHGVEQIELDGTPVNRAATNEQAFHLAQDGKGRLWAVGDHVGPVEFRHGKATLREELATGPGRDARDIETNPSNGDVWSCYVGGLLRRTESRWEHFTEKDGLLEDACRSLAVNGNGEVWYGYPTIEAMSLLKPQPNGPPLFRHFRASPEYEDFPAEFLDFDRRGWLWRGGNFGVYVADAAGAENGNWLHLSEIDGLDEVYMHAQGFYDDPDGSVWLISGTTLMHFTPPADLLTPRAASVFVSGVSWDGRAPQLIDAVPQLPSGAKVTAYLGSLEFRRRNALRVRYRLLPEQADWKEQRTFDIDLGKLGWGKHTLEVQGRELKGPWSNTASQSFTVERPMWATWPFMLGAVLLAMGTGAGTVTAHKRRVARERKALPDMGEWRLAALVPEGQQFVGTSIDKRFKVGRVIARGGFGTVLDATDTTDGRRCAVKVFRNDVADEWRTRRFLQEIAALEAIEHRHIVRILAHGSADGKTPYLVMEFVEGVTLRDLINRGPLQPKQTAHYLRQAGSALRALHSRGIYHRDVTPENMMIRESTAAYGDMVLIDFSIAIVQDPNQTMHGLSRAAGTLDYMAPEQTVGHAEPASDIYSLAKVLIEMLTGKRVTVLLPDAAMDLPRRAREFLVGSNAPFSRDSIQIIGDALQFDPARRPKDAVDFAERIAGDLENYQDQTGEACGAPS